MNTKLPYLINLYTYTVVQKFKILNNICHLIIFIIILDANVTVDLKATVIPALTLTNALMTRVCARTANVWTIQDRSDVNARWVLCILAMETSSPVLVSTQPPWWKLINNFINPIINCKYLCVIASVLTYLLTILTV